MTANIAVPAWAASTGPGLEYQTTVRYPDGARLLALLRMFLAHYVAWPSDAALNAVVLWICHAVARDRDDTGIGPLIWRATPRLLLTSAMRLSGKSTVLDLIVMLTRSRNGKMSKITPRAIAHTLGRRQETAVLDEAKLMFGSGAKSQELQGILLTGYTPRSTYTIMSGSREDAVPVFGPVAYAGKDELITDTNGALGDLLSRTIVIRMRRAGRARPELDEYAEDDAELLAAALVTWTDMMQAELRQAARDLAAQDQEASEEAAEDGSEILRTTQIWRPLRAVAAVAGGPWPEAADAACRELTAGQPGTEAVDTMDELERRSARWLQDPAGDLGNLMED